jgi:hypothetical protein
MIAVRRQQYTLKGLFVRIGIDTSCGYWNAPLDLETREFVYVPIPEAERCTLGLERKYDEVVPSLFRFSEKHGTSVKLPQQLANQNMHLDPDFNYLTYGDVGSGRGLRLTQLEQGDIIAFYSSMVPIKQNSNMLIYALIGFYVVNEVIRASEISKNRWEENAHTRRKEINDEDFVVRAKSSESGRLKRCIPIGEWRNKAYRVRTDILLKWGGLSVEDGYIQRSAVPPFFLHPEKFYKWFKENSDGLVQANNDV